MCCVDQLKPPPFADIYIGRMEVQKAPPTNIAKSRADPFVPNLDWLRERGPGGNWHTKASIAHIRLAGSDGLAMGSAGAVMNARIMTMLKRVAFIRPHILRL